uniref:Sodium channel and clathrin linker 1 n=1 Tax=Chelonoidis abingdonii TaxID=106734 RepID=A0A8C0GSK8_CHEAB
DYQSNIGNLHFVSEQYNKGTVNNLLYLCHRLYEELKEAVEKQLEALPSGTLLGSDVFAGEEIVRNLQDQLQLANQEKEQALELWQTVSQELDQLQQQYQGHMTEAQIHVVQRQKQKVILIVLFLLTNQQFLKTVTEQNMELEQLRKQLRSELSRQKLHTQELISQLEMANEKIAENEKLMMEHQEKVNRLQRRLPQAEQKAATASQQLSVITVQRKKAASMVDLENI